MRPVLKIREILFRYQQKLKLDFSSRAPGPEGEIKLSRQALDIFDATTSNHLFKINGYNAAQDIITHPGQALAQNSAARDLSSRINTA